METEYLFIVLNKEYLESSERKHCQKTQKFKDGLVSLINGISAFVGYLMPNPSF